jgi:hypothetical protein
MNNADHKSAIKKLSRKVMVCWTITIILLIATPCAALHYRRECKNIAAVVAVRNDVPYSDLAVRPGGIYLKSDRSKELVVYDDELKDYERANSKSYAIAAILLIAASIFLKIGLHYNSLAAAAVEVENLLHATE